MQLRRVPNSGRAMPLEPGTRLGHYEILERLGAGGMGVVYKARDARLKRLVALKMLPAELTQDATAKQRFLQEAEAASHLDHPNVCTVYEIAETPQGELYLAMAFYEGETLKQRIEGEPLGLVEAVEIAIQITQGLAKAHGAGIIHRDIKPANVMLTADGLVKILDFGLAKLADQAAVTQTGTVVGTVAYMSPEQAAGDVVDARTDLWSLGVVVYEMLSNERPFTGESAQPIINAIVNRTPRPLRSWRSDIPAELERIVTRLLSKSSERRYASTVELLADLRTLKRTLEMSGAAVDRATERPSIAVLPFTDMSPQKDLDYFCEGMAEEVIGALTKLEGLRVAARTSAFQFKGQAQDVRRIGEQLNVKTVLEGSVRTSGNRLRVTAQLVDVTDGYHLWAERYDRTMEDVFDIQDEIARAIVETLKVKLIGGESPARPERYTENLEAYHLYLQGRYYWFGRYKGGLQKAIQFFDGALKKDPAYAPAYAGLARSYGVVAFYGLLPPDVGLARARAAADQALTLAPDLAEAHAGLGMAHLVGWDWVASEEAFRRALRLDPGDVVAHVWFALLLSFMGRAREAIEQIGLAEQLDPLSAYVYGIKAHVLHEARRFEQGIEAAELALALDPNSSLALWALGLSASAVERHEQAVTALERAVETSGRAPLLVGFLGFEYGRAQRPAEAHALLDELLERSKSEYVEPLGTAVAYIGVNDLTTAIERLESGLGAHGGAMGASKVIEPLDILRNDPRFSALLRRMSFPLASGEHPLRA